MTMSMGFMTIRSTCSVVVTVSSLITATVVSGNVLVAVMCRELRDVVQIAEAGHFPPVPRRLGCQRRLCCTSS